MTGPGDGAGVVITLADIYRQVVGLAARVDTALMKQDRADQIVAEHEAALKPLVGSEKSIADHEARLRSLERSRWPITSITVLIAIAAVVVSTLNAIFGGK